MDWSIDQDRPLHAGLLVCMLMVVPGISLVKTSILGSI